MDQVKILQIALDKTLDNLRDAKSQLSQDARICFDEPISYFITRREDQISKAKLLMIEVDYLKEEIKKFQ